MLSFKLTYDDIKQYVKAMRLFQDEPKWTPLNRAPELDSNVHRKGYVSSLTVQPVA